MDFFRLTGKNKISLISKTVLGSKRFCTKILESSNAIHISIIQTDLLHIWCLTCKFWMNLKGLKLYSNHLLYSFNDALISTRNQVLVLRRWIFCIATSMSQRLLHRDKHLLVMELCARQEYSKFCYQHSLQSSCYN